MSTEQPEPAELRARLHQGPLQSLFAAMWALDLVDDEAEAERLDAVRAAIADAVAQLRDLIESLPASSPAGQEC